MLEKTYGQLSKKGTIQLLALLLACALSLGACGGSSSTSDGDGSGITPASDGPSTQLNNNFGIEIYKVKVGDVEFSDNLNLCNACGTGYKDVATGTHAVAVQLTEGSDWLTIGNVGPFENDTHYAVNIVSGSICAELWKRVDTDPKFNDDTTKTQVGSAACSSIEHPGLAESPTFSPTSIKPGEEFTISVKFTAQVSSVQFYMTPGPGIETNDGIGSSILGYVSLEQGDDNTWSATARVDRTIAAQENFVGEHLPVILYQDESGNSYTYGYSSQTSETNFFVVGWTGEGESQTTILPENDSGITLSGLTLESLPAPSDLTEPGNNTAIVMVNYTFSGMTVFQEYTYDLNYYTDPTTIAFKNTSLGSGNSNLFFQFSSTAAAITETTDGSTIKFSWTTPGGQVCQALACDITITTPATSGSNFKGSTSCMVRSGNIDFRVITRFNHLVP